LVNDAQEAKRLWRSVGETGHRPICDELDRGPEKVRIDKGTDPLPGELRERLGRCPREPDAREEEEQWHVKGIDQRRGGICYRVARLDAGVHESPADVTVDDQDDANALGNVYPGDARGCPSLVDSLHILREIAL